MSDQTISLREALDDLRAWCEMQREAAGLEETEFAAGEFLAYKRVVVHLRTLLMNHPAAPAEPPVIDREALRELVQAWKVGPHRPDTTKVERDNYRRRFVDAVMELAQPVDRGALIDALRRTAPHHEDHDGAIWVNGWAQDFADAVLAVLAGGDS